MPINTTNTTQQRRRRRVMRHHHHHHHHGGIIKSIIYKLTHASPYIFIICAFTWLIGSIIARISVFGGGLLIPYGSQQQQQQQQQNLDINAPYLRGRRKDLVWVHSDSQPFVSFLGHMCTMYLSHLNMLHCLLFLFRELA